MGFGLKKRRTPIIHFYTVLLPDSDTAVNFSRWQKMIVRTFLKIKVLINLLSRAE